MPITKSAKKTLKQSKKRRQLNLRRLRLMRKNIKKIEELSIENKQEAKKLIPETYKSIDKAVKRKIIKKNTAARKKSRMARITKESKVQPQTSPEQS
ncbi:30S ribosomal protein S20 [Patescibacteria group bacterium]|nr:30S ribosomal protein S20 [Patescibacteria group bacterium]